MTQQEFLGCLSDALQANDAPDANRIIAVYEARFAFREADGFRTEVIAADLSDPTALAARFAQSADGLPRGKKKALTATGLGLIDLMAAAVYALTWECVSLVGWFSLSALLFSPSLVCAMRPPGSVP